MVKALKIAIIMILALNGIYSLVTWITRDDAKEAQPYQMSQTLDTEAARDGLNLESLTSLIKEIRSGQELERRLNEKGSINNLDLNGDDQVDYIHVNEFGDATRKIGFSLTVQPEKDEVQEIASATVELNNNRAEIQVIGNEQIYGENAIYNDWTTVEREKPAETSSSSSQIVNYGFPLLASYFLLRPLWMSPFHYGYYPPFFSPMPIVTRTIYTSRINQFNTSTVRPGANSFQQTSGTQINNPNQGKTANRGVRRSLIKPTATQKDFQVITNRKLKSGGFGRSATNGSFLPSTTNRNTPQVGGSGNSGTSGRSFFKSRGSSFRGGSFRSSSRGFRIRR